MDNCKLFKARVGSHNYNLADDKSDIDYIEFVLPTFKDLYYGKKIGGDYHNTDDDLRIKDIRKFTEIIRKSNLSYLEILFSNDIEWNSDILYCNFFVKHLKSFIEENKERLARSNLSYLYNSMMGTYTMRRRLVERDLEGYKPKDLYHAYRMLDFLERFHSTESFEQSFRYNDQEQRDFLIKLKRGSITYSKVKKLLDDKLLIAEKTKEWYYSFSVDEEILQELDKKIRTVVRSVL